MLTMLSNVRRMIARGICHNSIFFLLLLSVAHLLYMHLCIFHLAVPRTFDYLIYLPSLCVMVMDVSILFLFLCIVSFGHRSFAAISSFWISLLWAFSNVVYYRFFHQYMPLSAISQAFNLKEGFMPDASSVFGVPDLFLLLTVTAFFFLLKYRKAECIQHRFRNAILIVIMPFIAFCAKCGTKAMIDEVKMIQGAGLADFIGITPREQELSIFTNGVFSGQVLYHLATSERIIELSPDQRMIVDRALNERNQNKAVKTDNDSIKTARCQKNLIFILIESLLSAPIDLDIEGHEVMPHLRRLKSLPGSYYNGRVRSNINIGQSSDGQFIYMTGLLPLSSTLTVTMMDNRIVIGLPQLLKDSIGFQSARIILPTSPAVWNQNLMNIKYGIDRTLASTLPMDLDGFSYLTDSQMFDMAITEDTKTNESDSPSFSLLLTISMHAPYGKSIDNSFKPAFPDNYSEEYIHYLQACHYTDAELGRYLSALAATDMLDNSIIVIASDHHIGQNQINMPAEIADCSHLPFFIVGADIDSAFAYHGKMNQLDVYTTLLDMYGISSQWQGLGSSILDHNSYIDYMQTDETQKISDLIILSNYLR